MQKDLKVLYKENVVPTMIKDFGYKNIQQVPKITKISLNRGFASGSKNSKEISKSLNEIAQITGQQPNLTLAKKSVAGFKIREGMVVGTSVTLRRKLMYNFLTKLIHIVFPRIRDFRGVNVNCFDGCGNYNIGLKEQLMFPEIAFDDVTVVEGLNISIITTAETDEEAYSLLKGLGMPFKK
jgi:large subunit ribosomal protein L5